MPNPGTRHEHVGTSGIARLTGTMTSGSSSFTVDSGTGFPTGSVGPFYVCIARGTANEEMVLCSSRSGNAFTVAASGRGVSGTVALAHSSTETVEHVLASDEVDQFDFHAASTSGIHGAAGAIVGTSDTQTLTNKTISGSSNTLSSIAQSSVTNLVSDLAGKSATSHLHTGTYANLSHTHAESDVTALVADLAAKQATSEKGQASGYAGLDANALLPVAQQLNKLVDIYTGTGSNQNITTIGQTKTVSTVSIPVVASAKYVLLCWQTGFWTNGAQMMYGEMSWDLATANGTFNPLTASNRIVTKTDTPSIPVGQGLHLLYWWPTTTTTTGVRLRMQLLDTASGSGGNITSDAGAPTIAVFRYA